MFYALPFLVLVLSVLLPTGVFAQEISGADDPGFIAARAAWLEGDDMEALSGLAERARAGNIAAKILLSRIADTPKVIDHVTKTLSRKERIALLREPKGLSGRDWLSSAAETNDLARALWRVQSSDLASPDLETIVPTLIRYGERSSLFDYVFKAHSYDGMRILAAAFHENLDFLGAAGEAQLGLLLNVLASSGQPLPKLSGIKTRREFEAYLKRLLSARNLFAYSGTFHLQKTAITPEARAQFVRDIPELQPIVLFCETQCAPSEMTLCLASGSSAIERSGGIRLAFSSPAQSLIDDTTYWSAPRFMDDLDRMMRKGNWSGCR